MSSGIQKLNPSQVEKFPSLQSYVQKCREQAAREGKGAEAFNLDQIAISNRYQRDGLFHILGNNPEQDFYCSAQINWKNHEMLIDSGTLSSQDRKPVGALWMSDACSLTHTLVGVEELGNQECRDGLLDPRLPVLARKDSIQIYFQECNQLLKSYGESFDRNWEGEIRPERVTLLNPDRGDGEFSLRFESSAYHFICEGQVSTLDHSMRIFAGDPRKPESMVATGAELTDACTLTREALGKSEFLGECFDKTRQERNIEKGLEWAWRGFWTGMLVRDLYKWYRGGWRQTLFGRTLLAIRHPITTLSRIAGTVGRGLTAARAAGSWLWNSRAVAALRTLVPRTAAFLSSTSRLALASRAGLGGLLVKGADLIRGGFMDDYTQSVEKKVTDRVYDKWVYSFEGVRKMEHWYDVIAVPLMPIRAACRWLAPNSMNRAVSLADENAPIREQVLAEDRQACEKNLSEMRKIFASLEKEPPEEEREKLLASIQEKAQFILGIKQNTDTINWAQEVFNADGTLKPGMEQKFLEKVQIQSPTIERGIA